MGVFKNIAKKVIGNSLNKKIDQSELPPEEKERVKNQTTQSVDLLSDNFEGHAIGSFKALGAFIVSIPAGPVAAFSAASTVALREANENEQRFIQGHIDRGIPISVDGKLIMPSTPPSQKAEEMLSSAWMMGGAALLIVAATAVVVLSPTNKE